MTTQEKTDDIILRLTNGPAWEGFLNNLNKYVVTVTVKSDIGTIEKDVTPRRGVSDEVNDAGNNSSGSGYNNTGYGRTYVAETVATGGSEINKYITKRIDLKNEASNIDVYISANKPKNANIDLYYKTLPAGSDSDFDSEAWVLDAPESVIPDNDGGIYNEVHYVIAPGANFGSFAIKLVLRTSDSSYVPSVKDFRAIAAL